MNKNEAEVVTDAFKSFAEQFGPDDIYTRIVLELVLEELFKSNYNKELSSEVTANVTKAD